MKQREPIRPAHILTVSSAERALTHEGCPRCGGTKTIPTGRTGKDGKAIVRDCQYWGMGGKPEPVEQTCLMNAGESAAARLVVCVDDRRNGGKWGRGA